MTNRLPPLSPVDTLSAVTGLTLRFQNTIAGRRLLRRDERVLVAVSGGADSMALLHLLCGYLGKPSRQLVIAHYNHRLRGRSSAADERFVKLAAKSLGVRCITAGADVKSRAKRDGVSIEMAARTLRHQFLAQTARRLRVHTVALAHHADDQVELFFLRLLRGSSAGGLAGMEWENPSPADSRVRLVRPLLGFTKQELINFTTGQGIRFREDASNQSADFLRNRIRRGLLPVLRSRFQPAVDRVVLRLMESLRDEAAYVRAAAEKWWRTKKRESFDVLPPAVQRRVIELQLIQLGMAPEFDLIESLRGPAGVPVMVAPKLNLLRNSEGVVSSSSPKCLEFIAGELAVNLAFLGKSPSRRPATGQFGGLDFRATPASATEVRRALTGRRSAGVEVFDADKIGLRITLRHWRPGDRFQPIGMHQPVKLQDWFVNRKVPAARRRELIVAEAADGVLCWVESERIGELFKLDSSTRHGLKWYWKRLAG